MANSANIDNEHNAMKVIQDTPLKMVADDRLGRENIVDLIVDSINDCVQKDHPCLVYGIYGKWGEGKTSLMNFVEEKLLAQETDDNINIIKFNPWLVNNDETLMREFFRSMTNKLDDKTREVFEKYGSLAILATKTVVNAFLPGLGATLAEGIALAKDALKDSQCTLSETKKNVVDSIIESKRHLVVMIDDVDRLDKEELHSVFRLIRQVADFDNCIYIVAMDIDIVSKSIGEYYGMGDSQDGRKFVDKIVQVPITLPYIPKCDMQRIVEDELTDILHGYADQVTKIEIAMAVAPFFYTYRELKRYCNQLQFVLPHLKGEVNIVDLCVLEAIKNVSAESYHRIYEQRELLLRQVSNIYYMKDEESKKAVDRMCQDAKDNVVNGLNGNVKKVIRASLDSLFEKRALYDDKNILEKRLNTDVYFAKYFAQMVPSNLIPDRILEEFRNLLMEMSILDIVTYIDGWASKYSAKEVKRASLYAIGHSEYGIMRCKTAGIIAKALSISTLAKNTHSSLAGRGEHISMFVSISVLRVNRYCFIDQFGEKIMDMDYDLYEDALRYIFEHAEINYAMGVYYDLSEEIYESKSLLKTVLPMLIDRYRGLPFTQQFEYSRQMLVHLFFGWSKLDKESWNEYATMLVQNEHGSCLKILEKFVEDKRDVQGIGMLLYYFGHCIDAFNEKLLLEPNVDQNDIVKGYFANYKQQLEEQKQK